MNNEDMAVKLEGHEHEIKSLKHRVNHMEEQQETIQQLVISVKELAMNMQSMIKEQERHSKAIEELENKPAKRWETVITVLITAVVTAVVTYFLSKVGM